MFYNPAMALDRDLGVSFVRAWASARPTRASGWEMMAATGVRGLRLLTETGAFGAFAFTEANPAAAELLARNVGSVPGATVLRGDARELPSDAPFDYVDLDPYGTPAPFVERAVAATRVGGILAVTATDMTVLAGAQPAACERRYGARPIRGRLGPEGGLRILLAFVAAESRRQGRAVRPLLSYVLGHHVRTYVEVGASSSGPDPIGRIDPTDWPGPDLGAGGPFGPMWLGPLFLPEVVERLELPSQPADGRALAGLLERIREEVAVDVPFYYEANSLAAALGRPAPRPRADLFAALRRHGYRAVRTHVRPEGFRTDAPRSVVESVVRGPSTRA